MKRGEPGEYASNWEWKSTLVLTMPPENAIVVVAVLLNVMNFDNDRGID